MTDLNNLTIIGRITRDLDENSFGYTNTGVARANVSIAVNRSKKQGEQWIDEVSYFDVTIWGKTAENLKPYLQKGTQIAVSGYLRQDRWEKDGKKNSRVTIVAELVQLVGGKKDGEGSATPKNDYQVRTNNAQYTGYQVDPTVNTLGGANQDGNFTDSSEIPF